MKKKITKLVSGIVCGLIILSGAAGMGILAGMKEEPVQKEKQIKPLAVQVQEIVFDDFPIHIEGFGTAVCRDITEISPDISGKVVWVNPDLETGRKLEQGQILFKIDPIDLKLKQKRIQAQVEEIRQNIKNLTFQYEVDREREKEIERNQKLALSRYERLKSLYDKGRFATRVELEKAQMDLNTVKLSKLEMEKQLTLYPGEIQIEQFRLESCRADLDEIRLNIDRCVIRAPFSGRVKKCLLENGMHVDKAVGVVTLCDETSLEIHVPLSAQDLAVLSDSPDPYHIQGTGCIIGWTDIDYSSSLKGSVDRILQYDGSTRTLMAAIRVLPGSLQGQVEDFRLMEGMFCRVRITGQPLKRVARLPQSALQDDNRVYKVTDNRLEMVSVEIAGRSGSDVFISSGLFKGNLVAISRISEIDQTRKVIVAETGNNHD